ncbi:unnamed protein product, partial [Didymodactylos carnosus]
SASNATYLSLTIQNELIHHLGSQVRESIAEKVGNRLSCIMVDEARDISGSEQLSVVLRVVDDKHVLGIIKIVSDVLKGKQLDFSKASILMQSTISQMTDLRSEQVFKNLFVEISKFTADHQIDLNVPSRLRRIPTLSTRFKDSIITGTIGHQDVADNEYKFRTSLYYPLLDAVLIELNDRFSNKNCEILSVVPSLSPDSPSFLNADNLIPLASMVKCNVPSLTNEITVLKNMLKDTKSKTIIDVYFEIVLFKQAFSSVLSLLRAAITLP